MVFNFRKVASVLASATMVSSTVALAAAANYPMPFVQNGNADVAIVYGSNNPASTDLAAVTDISNSLNAALAAQATSGTTTTTVTGGDSVVLKKSSNNVNLNDVVSSVFGTTVDDEDLSSLLADGTYNNDENTEFDYEQKITLGSGLQLNYFKDSDYNDNQPSLGVNLSSDQLVLSYELDFTTAAESDVSGGDLVDLETTNLMLLGTEYFVLDVDNSTLDITLLDSANSAIVNNGETVTISTASKTYDVSIVFISTSEVKLDVNGESTNSLSEGGTYKLSDGSYVGIKDILASTKEGTVDKVEISIGKGKLELKNDENIELNDDTVQEITSRVDRGTNTGGKETIDKIVLNWTTDDEQFLTSDNSLTMPGFGILKLSSTEFMTPASELTTVTEGSTTYIQLETAIKDSEVTIPLLYVETTTGNFTGIGKDSSNILRTDADLNVIFNETAGDELLVASWNTSTESESYLLKFDFVTENNVNKTTIRKYQDGTTTEVCTKKTAGDDCDIGSLTLTINEVIRQGSAKAVNFSGNAGSSFNRLFTDEGLMVYLPYEGVNSSASPGLINLTGAVNATGSVIGPGTAGHNWDTFDLVFVEENKDEDVAAGAQFNVTLDDNSDNEVQVSTISTGRSTLSDPDDSNTIYSYVYSDLATKVERQGQASDQRDAFITYNGGESYADIILSSSDATVGGGSAELGSVSITDSEASSSSSNLIVVGGACVNNYAASLLGSSTPLCGSAWETATGVGSGSFLIQTFDKGSGKVATLVAGYNAGDTTNAATALTTQTIDTSVNKKYVGQTATSVTSVTA